MAARNIVIAIDGFSSCGKSTLAKALAKKIGFLYVDSGAMYRAVTLYLLRHRANLEDSLEIGSHLENIELDMQQDGDVLKVSLNGEDVSQEIRSMEVSEKVSEVSALKEVRKLLVKQQQAWGAKKNIVMDGRDIGTTVFPNASVKIFMTAEPYIRAERRFAELAAKGETHTMEEIVENLTHRDYIDSTREESPLRQASDAILINNSLLTEDEQLQIVLDIVSKVM